MTDQLPAFPDDDEPTAVAPEDDSGVPEHVPQRRRAVRQPEGAWVAGVATGIAAHLDWPVWLVRAGFVALGAMQLIGVFAYGLLWMLMPPAGRQQEAPGLEAAQRSGMRSKEVAPRNGGLGAGTVMVLAGGGMLAARTMGSGTSGSLFWPLLIAAAGLALVWRQADVARPEPGEPAKVVDRIAAHGGWRSVAQVAVGLALVAAAVSLVALGQVGLAQLPMMLGMSALMVLGIGIAGAPWIARLRRTQQEAHERIVVEQARADMAAHLHDSVLQTLALIQRQADDPKAVAQLARRQERELRTWLYGEQTTDASLKAALTRAAAEIEDERGIGVELVCVGDTDLDEGTTALVRAAREAMMNAAKHSGAPRVDVYCEVEDARVEAFVRDRGAGFDLDAVADDRMGVRRSIIERMERHGGSARLRSTPGEGTEVVLVMER